jgi:hypothetical protein
VATWSPSCATRVTEGMVVTTRNERIHASRKTALELLLSNHYADCISPCMEGCPAHVDAQGYIALAAMGEPEKAVDLIREANPLPAVCGRICVRKCEVVCRREDVDTPVAINNIKRHVTDSGDIYTKDPVVEPDTGKTVGMVGSGPASLTAAWFLAKRGIKTVMYEALEKSGGMLRYGIPESGFPMRCWMPRSSTSNAPEPRSSTGARGHRHHPGRIAREARRRLHRRRRLDGQEHAGRGRARHPKTWSRAPTGCPRWSTTP